MYPALDSRSFWASSGVILFISMFFSHCSNLKSSIISPTCCPFAVVENRDFSPLCASEDSTLSGSSRLRVLAVHVTASADLLEFAGRLVLAHVVPMKVAPVHSDVNSVRKGLDEGQGAPEIEKPVRAAKLVRNHRSCENDRLVLDGLAESSRRFSHGVRAVRDDDPFFLRPAALFRDDAPAGIRHVQTVDHHQGPDSHRNPAAAQGEHFGQMCVFEKQRSLELVVLLVEGSAGHEYCDRRATGSHLKLLHLSPPQRHKEELGNFDQLAGSKAVPRHSSFQIYQSTTEPSSASYDS